MARVLIDASNLHVGGGVQVAASFIDELHLLRSRGTTPWLADVDVEVSSQVWESLVTSVCRDAPVYIDPEDPVGAAGTVIRVLGDPEEVLLHVKRGYEVIADLPTAADRAARYVEIIDSLVGES